MLFRGGQVLSARSAWSFLCRDDPGFLERKDVSAGHHKMRCKRMAQNMSKLPAWKHD